MSQHTFIDIRQEVGPLSRYHRLYGIAHKRVHMWCVLWIARGWIMLRWTWWSGFGCLLGRCSRLLGGPKADCEIWPRLNRINPLRCSPAYILPRKIIERNKAESARLIFRALTLTKKQRTNGRNCSRRSTYRQEPLRRVVALSMCARIRYRT